MGRGAKHGVKQVDRLVSNKNFDLHSCFRAHVRAVLGSRRSIITALDWTEFAPDDQATICLYLITNHGRATPLVWKTVELTEMRGRRNSFEDDVLHLFKESLPKEGAPKVVVLADRGFSDVALYAELEEELGFDFVIRFRRNVLVQYGERRLRSDQWLAEAGGHSVQLRGASLTSRFRKVVNFVALHDSNMRDSWFLASSLPGSVKAIAKLYGRRFTIEETFRDQKDMRFGWALHDIQVTQPVRRDRLLFLAALAQVLLTLLGAAGEQLGLDAGLRVNTTKRRTHSLPRQGREYIRGCSSSGASASRAVHRFAQFSAGSGCQICDHMRGFIRQVSRYRTPMAVLDRYSVRVQLMFANHEKCLNKDIVRVGRQPLVTALGPPLRPVPVPLAPRPVLAALLAMRHLMLSLGNKDGPLVHVDASLLEEGP